MHAKLFVPKKKWPVAEKDVEQNHNKTNDEKTKTNGEKKPFGGSMLDLSMGRLVYHPRKKWKMSISFLSMFYS